MKSVGEQVAAEILAAEAEIKGRLEALKKHTRSTQSRGGKDIEAVLAL